MELSVLNYMSLKTRTYLKEKSLFLVLTIENSYKLLKNTKFNFLAIKNSLLKFNLKLCTCKILAPFISKTVNLFCLTVSLTQNFIQTFIANPGFLGLLLNKSFYNSFQLNNLKFLSYQHCNINFVTTLKKSITKLKMF